MEFVFVLGIFAIIGLLSVIALLSFLYYLAAKYFLSKLKAAVEHIKEGVPYGDNNFKCFIIASIVVVAPPVCYCVFLSPVILLAIGLSIAHVIAYIQA